jgi:hypothetical protein
MDGASKQGRHVYFNWIIKHKHKPSNIHHASGNISSHQIQRQNRFFRLSFEEKNNSIKPVVSRTTAIHVKTINQSKKNQTRGRFVCLLNYHIQMGEALDQQHRSNQLDQVMRKSKANLLLSSATSRDILWSTSTYV